MPRVALLRPRPSLPERARENVTKCADLARRPSCLTDSMSLAACDGRMERSTILARLNDATYAHQRSADAPWLTLLVPNVSRHDYAHRLAVTYGFEAPIESALSYTKGLDALVQFRARSRAGLLAQDLLALGHSPADVTALPQCSSITAFDDLPEALGWAYVVERTGAHHELILRYLIQRLPITRTASSYLAASTGAATMRWHALGQVLDRLATTRGLVDRVLMAAERGYRRLREWNEAHRHEEPSPARTSKMPSGFLGETMEHAFSVVTDESKTIDLCGHEHRRARCIRERGHGGPHEASTRDRIEPLRWG
jgi:heme oxygenase (biliverdin-IX-beta and delta-forming)